MSNVWDRFNEIVPPSEVEEAKNQFELPEEGNYNVTLEGVEPSESKDGLPMLKAKFKVIETGRYIFFNQMLQNLNFPNMTSVNIANAVAFAEKLIGEEIIYTNLGEFAELVEKIPTGGRYEIKVFYSDKDTEHKYVKLRVLKNIDNEDKDAELE